MTQDVSQILLGNRDLRDETFVGAQVSDISEKIRAAGDPGTTESLSFPLAAVHTMTPSGPVTISFASPPPAGQAGWLTVMVTNGGSNVTWPDSVDWGEAGEPTLKTAGLDILTFMTIDEGATWYGSLGWTSA